MKVESGKWGSKLKWKWKSGNGTRPSRFQEFACSTRCRRLAPHQQWNLDFFLINYPAADPKIFSAPRAPDIQTQETWKTIRHSNTQTHIKIKVKVNVWKRDGAITFPEIYVFSGEFTLNLSDVTMYKVKVESKNFDIAAIFASLRSFEFFFPKPAEPEGVPTICLNNWWRSVAKNLAP